MTNKKELTADGVLENDDKDVFNQLLGQIQMADAYQKFSVTVTASKLAYIKEHKLYKELAGKTGNGYPYKGTWEDCCKALGISREKADLDIANLKAFGEDALECLGRMGIGYRDLRQLRKLPENVRLALTEAAKSGDENSFTELAEDIISQSEKDQAAIEKSRDETKADYDAQSALLKDKAAELDSTKLELEKSRRHLQGLSIDKKMKAVREELGNVTYEIESLLAGKFREGVDILFNEDPNKHNVFLSASLKQIEIQIIALRDEYGLSDEISAEGELGWLGALDDDEKKEKQFDFVEGEFTPHAVPQKIADEGA